MSTNDVTAPGRSALWTEAALRALTGAATALHDSACGIFVDEDMIQHRARAIATAFEQACIKQHAEELAAARAELERQRTEWRATVLRVGRYAIRGDLGDEVRLIVRRVSADDTVWFEPHPGIADGESVCDDLSAVATGENGWTPAPLDAPAPQEAP